MTPAEIRDRLIAQRVFAVLRFASLAARADRPAGARVVR